MPLFSLTSPSVIMCVVYVDDNGSYSRQSGEQTFPGSPPSRQENSIVDLSFGVD